MFSGEPQQMPPCLLQQQQMSLREEKRSQRAQRQHSTPSPAVTISPAFPRWAARQAGEDQTYPQDPQARLRIEASGTARHHSVKPFHPDSHCGISLIDVLQPACFAHMAKACTPGKQETCWGRQGHPPPTPQKQNQTNVATLASPAMQAGKTEGRH